MAPPKGFTPKNHRNGSRRKGVITQKQLRLVDEYFMNGFNKKAAAASLGFKSPGIQCMRLFDHPEVVKEIEKRRAGLQKKWELTEDWIVKKLMMLVDASLGDVLIKLQESNYDLSVLTDEEKYALSEFSEETYKEGRGPGARDVKKMKVKLAEKLGPLVALGRKMGIFNDKLKLEGEVSLVERLQRGRDRARAAAEAVVADAEADE